METFSLDGHPYIELCDLLKIQGWCHSGAAAKTAIYGQQVKVNGAMETRKRCKIVTGQQVEFLGQVVKVVE
ncbi:ribosome-associated protein YbcJ [Sodalis sp. C49]|uniref:ribosome-associated protein YbcJ n=1 Tax=unclassified Sodalis (in: enterobacteria) TaxID=2636512 RepID=UPI003965AA45